MIGINFYVLCCLGRCELTPIHIVGTIDRMCRSDIYFGKLVFKRLSLVPEAYYWFKLSIFFSLHATCLDQFMPYATCVYTLFKAVKLPKKFLKAFSKFHWKRIRDQVKYCHVPECLRFQNESYKISQVTDVRSNQLSAIKLAQLKPRLKNYKFSQIGTQVGAITA